MLCWFLLYNNLNQPYVYIYSLPLGPPSHLTPLGCQRALDWAPCVTQQFPTSYLFFTWSCIYVSATFSICPNLSIAPHSSTLAWKIPWTEEPGRLQSMGSLGVGHDWAASLWLFTFMHCRRKWQPTPVFLPGESHGQRNLVGCPLWGRTESDMTEVT